MVSMWFLLITYQSSPSLLRRTSIIHLGTCCMAKVSLNVKAKSVYLCSFSITSLDQAMFYFIGANQTLLSVSSPSLSRSNHIDVALRKHSAVCGIWAWYCSMSKMTPHPFALLGNGGDISSFIGSSLVLYSALGNNAQMSARLEKYRKSLIKLAYCLL